MKGVIKVIQQMRRGKHTLICLFLLLSFVITMVCDTGVIAAKEEKTAKALKKITFQNNFLAIRLGEKVKLSVSYKPKQAAKRDLKFKSLDKKALQVSKKGVLTAKKNGLGKKIKVVAYSKKNGKIRDRIWVRILPEIDKKKPMIAVTFDDGPNAPTTNRIVTALKKNGAVATFFEIGANLENPKNKQALKRAFLLGNEIGSHTLNHKRLTGLENKEAAFQNNKCLDLIEKITGTRPILMRPPYGSYDKRIGEAVNMPMIMWSVDTLDWQTLNPDKTYQSAMTVKDGGIILMHSIYTQTAEATERILPTLKKKGFQFVTVSELFKYKKKTLRKGSKYNNA